MRFGPLLARSATAGLVAAAATLAWVQGGGADARVRPPRAPHDEAPAAARDAGASSPEPTSKAPPAGPEAYEARTRLVETIGDAVVDVPNLSAALPFFQAYWRKLRGPWVRVASTAGQLVTTIALRTNPQAEKQWAVATQTGLSWVPNVRVWNMNEGSFDQREALFAPTPATLRFRMPLPPSARFRFSAAVATSIPATTIFEVSLVDAKGDEHTVTTLRVPPAEERRWIDVDADLAPWGDQPVELRLRTTADRPGEGEKRALAAPSGEPGLDGGIAERTPVPPMALALWGDPVVVARAPARAPYNVLWIVVDALRPDVAASLHDPAEDARKLGALRPPLEALLPAISGLMPAVDRLAARGVHFTHAWSAASWTRPGTLAMLTGERSSEVGIDTTNWVQPAERAARYYRSDPPLVPRVLRKDGMVTAAFVNNFFMTGYAAVGLDMGFERITDHRYRTRDTSLITYDALRWLDGHSKDRFFLFVNYNSPHEPYDPPKEMLERIPPSPAGPRDPQVRAYMAEAAKDDVGIGVLLEKLQALGLTRSTLVILTADHGETLSAAHDGAGFIGQDRVPQRFHHAVGNFEETTRIPIVMALPGVVEGGRAIADRVRNIDIAPTVLELEGLEPDPRMSGRSLLPLIEGRKEPEARVVVSEGRMSRAVLWGKWRLVAHDPAPRAQGGAPDAGAPPEDELFDLDEDPGERHNVAQKRPDVVAEMRARLAAALVDVPAADAPAPTVGPLPVVRFRFAGAGKVHQVTGSLTLGDARHAATAAVTPEGIPREAIRASEGHLDFELSTPADGVVGFDVRVDPPAAPIVWQLYLDSAPWPDGATFVGPFGLPAVASKAGIFTDDARAEVFAPALPVIDPARDLGVFVTRDRADKAGDLVAAGPTPSGEGAKEMQRVLEEWGYAHGSH
ncbi:MAG: sulfatase [Myxococcales bacterium]|nr:sulfatase [Myxococcales bacterium]